MNSINDLKEKLEQLEKQKREYISSKKLDINKLLIAKNTGFIKNFEKIFENLEEIDREIETFEIITTNAISLAKSIIHPIKEKETCLTNIANSIDLLFVENKIKSLLIKIKNEKSTHAIENKINIILEANNLIHINPLVFENYRESFLKESQDVVNHLESNFNSLKDKIMLNENNKAAKTILEQMDKSSILLYKMTNNLHFLQNYFDVVYINIKNNVNIINLTKIKDSQKSVLIENLSIVSKSIFNIFKDLAINFNRQKAIYIKELESPYIFYKFMLRLIKNTDPIITNIFCQVISLCDLITYQSSPNDKIDKGVDYLKDLDIICEEISYILRSLENFRFFSFVLIEKIKLKASSELYENEIFSKEFYDKLYQLGDKYANYEIKIIKENIKRLFKEDCKTFLRNLETNITADYHKLVGITLITIDDLFFILRKSSLRAINSFNIQLAIGLFNHINAIISEDLIEIMDLKISTILFKTNFKSYHSVQKLELSYVCKEEPCLSYKFCLGNLFLISCLNSIDQIQSNISSLYDILKAEMNDSFFDSFNHETVILDESAAEKEHLDNYHYIKKSVKDMFNMTLVEMEKHRNGFEELLLSKMKIAFEFLINHIKSVADILNSNNFFIKENLEAAEQNDPFSIKYIEETEKILKQWKLQFSENNFNKFLTLYVDYTNIHIEKILHLKTFSNFGAILLEKDVNKLINFFQSKATFSIRDRFTKLIAFSKILNFESNEELNEYLKKYDDLNFMKDEIYRIRKLKKD